MRYVYLLLFLFMAGCSLFTDDTGGNANLSGVVSAGPVSNAHIAVYSINPDGTEGYLLGSATANSSGKFSLHITGANRPLIIVASGGSYIEEASASIVNMGGAKIRTVLPLVSDGQEVGVTPVTEIAAQNAMALIGANGSLSAADLIRTSNSTVAVAMGLSDITLPPANPTEPAASAANAHAAQYALVLAAISQMAKDAEFNAGSSVNSLDIMQALAVAFKYNNNFNSDLAGVDIPVTNGTGASITLRDVMGGVSNFASAMQSAAMAVGANMPEGFGDPSVVSPPDFVTAPPAFEDFPGLVVPDAPSEVPWIRPVDDEPSVDEEEPPSFDPVNWLVDFSENQNIAYASAMDSEKNIVIVGGTLGLETVDPQSNTDAYVMKYDSEGNLLWARQFGTTGGTSLISFDSAQAVAIDSDNNIYVAGHTYGSLDHANYNQTQLNANRADIFVHKYDPDGNLLWGKQYGTPYTEVPTDIAVDESGQVFVVGTTNGAMEDFRDNLYWDAFLMKLDSSGDLEWVRQIGNASQPDAINAIKLDSAGNIFVGGCRGVNRQCQGYFAKYNSAGQFIFKSDLGGDVYGLTMGSDGNVFVTGGTEGAGDGFLARYSGSAGQMIWTKIFSGADRLFRIALDENDNAVVCGQLAQPSYPRGVVAKFTSEGELIGSYLLEKNPSQAINVILDSSNIFVLGRGGFLLQMADWQ